MSEHGYRVIYEPLAEGGFQVIVPALPGIVTYGSTIEEAREMAQDAIACHLQGLLKDNEEIPEDRVPSVVLVETRPIRESTGRGNAKARPSGAKPVATAKPEGRPVSSSGNGASQGSASAQTSSQKR